jgi:hypothetical protein
MRSLIFLLFCLYRTGCLAQITFGFEEAFIMTKKGDSIRGFVEVGTSYGSKIGYKKAVGDVPTSIRTKEIKFILTPIRYLENVPLGKRELLVTLVADGKIRLFFFEKELGSMRFIAKKGLLYTEVTRKNYTEILSSLMFDCPEVIQKLRQNVFAYEKMDKAVTEYNACQ